ncbi:MAG: Uma2 family endonuclease, partial [Anaerolineales bacterium]
MSVIMSSPAAEAVMHEVQVEPVSKAGLRVSEVEYWRRYYLEPDVHYEWNDGRLEEKPVSDYETYLVYAWFTDLLRRFLSVHPIAAMVALEMGFRLPLPHKTVIRKPDLGVVTRGNPQPLLPLDCSYHGIFDLCIEALSDKERPGIERDAVTKKQEYARAGVREYYILHREEGLMGFFRLDERGVYVPMERADGVIRSAVLPGFRFRVQDLLHQPQMDDLRGDPLYCDFVLPGWHEAERRADEEA